MIRQDCLGFLFACVTLYHLMRYTCGRRHLKRASNKVRLQRPPFRPLFPMKIPRFIVFALSICALLAVLPTGSGSWAQVEPEQEVYFAPTGQYLDGTFLDYWQSHGGLPIFGYPLTPAFRENGHTVQYFERARFELHPENAGSDYEVLLGQLGSERLKSEGRAVPPPDGTQAAPGEVLFPETGYKVGSKFLQYWQEHGGLAQFGYPVSPETRDESSGLAVQYFERARFELHPENAGSDYEVLLTRLGVERAKALEPLLTAQWPGNLPVANFRLGGEYGTLHTLDVAAVQSDIDGEAVVLGGDDRVYARYPLKGGEELDFTIAGMWGEQSLVLEVSGEPVAALWGALKTVGPVWGVQTGDPTWDGLYDKVKGFLEKDSVDYLAPDDETLVHGYRSPDNIAIWLRDHVYQSKGFKYFEPDMTSTLDYFRSTQRADGSYDDYLYHTIATPVFTDQIGVEADREYLFVEGVWRAWQATGNDDWLRENVSAMERGMEYLWTDPNRWSLEYGLIKRAFTIDTWDFEQGSDQGNVRRNIDDQTKWSIMHGDNTGAYHAATVLAAIENYLGRYGEGQKWQSRAQSLKENLNKVAWNGNFYTHQIHLTPVDPTGVDESTQLSLSNAYALNRGTLSHEQAAALIRTYQQRREQNQGKIFAEWYSIDPSFPTGFGPQGEYVNGGVMPLVGGELARGAFDEGFETYGADILRRYYAMIEKDGGTYLWYYPDGRPGVGTDQTLNTDGWGSSAMLAALTEGLAGVNDDQKLFESVSLAPKWSVDCAQKSKGCYGKDHRVGLEYPASGAFFAYKVRYEADGRIELAWGGRETEKVQLHLLLPEGAAPTLVTVNGRQWAFSISRIESSVYLDAALPGQGQLEMK